MSLAHQNEAPHIYQEHQQQGSFTTLTHEGHSLGTSAMEVTPEEERRMLRESLLPLGAESKPNEKDGQHTTTLHRSWYIVFITLLYVALALFAWVVTCILTFKPIGARRYGVSVVNSDNDGWGWGSAAYIHNFYVNSENYYKAARTIQSIVAVLTIPIASAACSRAAVVFIQRNSQVTMRQTMLLADKAWNDPILVTKLFGRWKSYGSSLLFAAILLNGLGAIISPLQEIFLSTTTIKTPTWPQLIGNLPDFYDLFNSLYESSYDAGYVTTLTRSKLAATSNTPPQARLWSGSPDCNSLTNTDVLSMACVLGGGHSTLANLTWLEDPFFSPLPSGFSTGLVRQFAPRINSTARRENITANEFPKDCDKIPGALYIQYSNVTDLGYTSETYSVEVCMPANMTASPWKAQHERQDFSEELYLNISLHNFTSVKSGTYYSKITLNTTGGFFELPNYMNGEVPGPLIQDDPSNYCGTDCEPQGYNNPIYNHNITKRSLSNISEATGINATQDLMSNVNKGPLLTVALALFGMGSFIDTRGSYEAYASSINDRELSNQCVEMVPFIPLLRDFLDQSSVSDPLDPCLSYSAGYFSTSEQVAAYLWAFVWNDYDGYAGGSIQNAFTAAAFLANEAWLTSAFSKTFTVTYDPGADTDIPVLSRPGMILISVLLGIFLGCLVAMSIYGAWAERWTEQLDAFAMMRIGAAMGDRVPLKAASSADNIKVLNEFPGGIGDASGGEGKVGELAIGAKTPLQRRRLYRSY